MKLSLDTDFGSPHIWERVIEFAHNHGVSRLVFWGDFTNTGFRPPYLYPKYPKLMPEDDRPKIERLRERLRHAAEMTICAGMEFWYVFQVLEIPKPEHVRTVLPELLNEHGEPEMSGHLVYQLIRDQLDELFDLEPRVYGIELWVMECASIRIADLKHQKLSTKEICAKIVETVHDHIVRTGRKLAVDLHTAGGDTATLQGLFEAAVHHPDIIVSGDNVIGDFQLHLPFNSHLKRAAKTNPIQVHFDLNGEFWGRNFVPTSALSQYAAHIEEARRLRAVYIDGRVSTGHDSWSPHANVLPSRRRFYPALEQVSDYAPLPNDLEISCMDTLGAFNAEFFCRRVKDPQVQPEDVIGEFLCGEFGGKAESIVPIFMKLENTLGKIFFTDKNYYVVQSCRFWMPVERTISLDVQLTSPPGTDFPPPEVLKSDMIAAFAGWPTPLRHKSAGTEAMIREKVEALNEAEEMLKEVKRATQEFKPEDREFLIKQFEDLVFFARAYRFLLEAQAHHFLTKNGKKRGNLPNPVRLEECLNEVRKVASEWETRYPAGRYGLSETLLDWVKIMEDFMG